VSASRRHAYCILQNLKKCRYLAGSFPDVGDLLARLYDLCYAVNNTHIPCGDFYPKEFWKMADQEAYCVKCRATRTMKDAKIVTNDKGRKMAKGVCPVCGTKMTRFLKSS